MSDDVDRLASLLRPGRCKVCGFAVSPSAVPACAAMGARWPDCPCPPASAPSQERPRERETDGA